jgi:ribosomal protein S18 acetylase RimI-like enzyme
MPLLDPSAPWLGLDSETLRFLEIHRLRAMTVPGRAWRDLGDSVMLFSAVDTDPFFNRLAAVRWPSDRAAFDARLGLAKELFSAVERRPCLWVVPGLSTPPDIIARLEADGFADQGGGLDLVLVRSPFEPVRQRIAGEYTIERWNQPAQADLQPQAEALALVVGEAFGIPGSRHTNLVREIGLTLGTPSFHTNVVTIGGEPVAVGSRYTFDGASYLSSIGTRSAWRGRGFGSMVTLSLAQDSIAAGVGLVYLSVHADNDAAIRLYGSLGFGVTGPMSADMLLG